VIDVAVHPEWAPLGAARFKQARTARSDCNTNEVQTPYSGWVLTHCEQLVEEGFYDSTYFFRVIPGFMAQASATHSDYSSNEGQW
jgi:cyclophilin family peptidyl-prolyl cis-trans isomerase